MAGPCFGESLFKVSYSVHEFLSTRVTWVVGGGRSVVLLGCWVVWEQGGMSLLYLVAFESFKIERIIEGAREG